MSNPDVAILEDSEENTGKKFARQFQMWQRLLFGILLAVGAYFVVQYLSTEPFEEQVVVEEPKPRGDMQVSSGGTASPNVAPPRAMTGQMAPPPEASDPYSETSEDVDASENLRFPERSFGPGLVPQQTATHQMSGMAGNASESAQAVHQFNPELVTNGGAFFGSVTAVEDENPNYSAF